MWLLTVFVVAGEGPEGQRHRNDTRSSGGYLKNQPVDIVLALMPYCNLISIAAARSLRAKTA